MYEMCVGTHSAEKNEPNFSVMRMRTDWFGKHRNIFQSMHNSDNSNIGYPYNREKNVPVSCDDQQTITKPWRNTSFAICARLWTRLPGGQPLCMTSLPAVILQGPGPPGTVFLEHVQIFFGRKPYVIYNSPIIFFIQNKINSRPTDLNYLGHEIGNIVYILFGLMWDQIWLFRAEMKDIPQIYQHDQWQQKPIYFL